MTLSLLTVLGCLIVTTGYVAVDHATLAAAWGMMLGFWGHVAVDEVAEHLGGRE